MRIVQFESRTMTAGSSVTIDCHAIGAYGVYVAAKSSVAGARFTLLDTRTGSIQADTLMAAELGRASFQVPAVGCFPIVQGSLVIQGDGVNTFQIDVSYLDEPPQIPWGRWLAFLSVQTLAASATLAIFSNLVIGRVARVSGLLKTTRTGSCVLSYGNTDDITWNVGNFLNVAGATGGVSSVLTQLTHPWSTWTLSNNDAALPNTLSLCVWVDTAMR